MLLLRCQEVGGEDEGQPLLLQDLRDQQEDTGVKRGFGPETEDVDDALVSCYLWRWTSLLWQLLGAAGGSWGWAHYPAGGVVCSETVCSEDPWVCLLVKRTGAKTSALVPVGSTFSRRLAAGTMAE
jgi:hypothetical protein